MVTDGIMLMIQNEIDKARALHKQLLEHDQPLQLCAKQQGVIDGLELAFELLANYEEA